MPIILTIGTIHVDLHVLDCVDLHILEHTYIEDLAIFMLFVLRHIVEN